MIKKNIKPATKKRGKRISRNEPCPCGSGKKHKKCCRPVNKNE